MKYTEQELIDELHRVSEEHCGGNRPTISDMDLYGKISSGTYKNRFQKWTNAIKEADLYDKEINRYRITKEKLKKEITRLSKNFCNGKTPSQNIMEQHGKYCVPVYYNRFGSWNEALKECGFKPNRIIDKSDEEVLDEIKYVSDNYCDGNTPRQKDMNKYGKWNQDIYIERFGSWSNAVKEAGFEPNTPYDFILSGSNNPLWKEDKGYGDSWKPQKRKTLKRDNYRCRVCLKTESEIGQKPSVHHIKPRYKWDVKNNHEEMNSLENLVCLCVSCHGKLEEKFIRLKPNDFVRESRKKLGIEKT